MWSRTLTALAPAIALLLAACGSGTAGSTPVTTTPPATAAATAAPSPATPAPVAGDEPFALLTDSVVYHEDDAGAWSMDVFYPDAEGPWPLVIVYNGMSTSTAAGEAREIAARGAVAVAPQWLKVTPPELTLEDYIDGGLFDRAACAVNAAQHLAADYGADPTRTTVAGFSAGMHPTGWVGLGVVRNDVCQTPQLYQPVGLVMGDSQFLFYEQGWDSSLADPESPAADTVDRFVNPERWDVPDNLAVYLWTSDYPYGRDIENPPSAESWIQSRDTTGTLINDLTVLEAFDDKWVDWMDNGLLMEMRMKGAGLGVIHEAVGGEHAYSSRVFDAIESLISR